MTPPSLHLALLPVIILFHVHELTSGLILLAGIVMATLALLAWRASVRRASSRLRWVAGAFALLALKDLMGAWAIYTEAIAHEHLELILTSGDLVAGFLLASPLFLRSGKEA